MKVTITTPVEKSYLEVKEGFNESLFTELSPPFPPVKLLRFDGSSKGDLVSLELDFFLFKQKWTSEITEDKLTDQEFYFIDKGVELPFFLKEWKHTHRIIKNGEGAMIRDEIEYKAPFFLLSWLLYPAMLVQFWYRTPVYQRIFKSDD